MAVVEPGCEPGPERERRALIERVARAWLSAPRCDSSDVGASADAVLELLESGRAGVLLMAGEELQALRDARSEVERWRGMAEAVVADGLVRCLHRQRGIGDAGRCGECAGCAMRAAVAEVAP